MEKLIAFFEIPAADFNRAVAFYETIFHLKLSVYDCEQEKMAFFMENGDCIGSISFGKDFPPSEKGTLLSFNCENMSETQALIESNGAFKYTSVNSCRIFVKLFFINLRKKNDGNTKKNYQGC